MRNLFGLFLLVALLGGCSSSPQKNYYLLSSVAPLPTEGSQAITRVIGVGPVEVAEYLNRLQIVWQSGQGELVMSGNHYWAESLEKGITRTLTLNLTAADSSRSLVAFPWRADARPRYSLRLNVQSLDKVGSQAVIDAVWQLMDNDTGSVLNRQRFIRSAPAGQGVSGLTQAYSALLGELARDMEKALGELEP